MNNQSVIEFMGEFMTPERINPDNWAAFAIQIRNTFPENDHIRERVTAINNGE